MAFPLLGKLTNTSLLLAMLACVIMVVITVMTHYEALVGLLMIGRSASYAYLLVERLWRLHRPSRARGPD